MLQPNPTVNSNSVISNWAPLGHRTAELQSYTVWTKVLVSPLFSGFGQGTDSHINTLNSFVKSSKKSGCCKGEPTPYYSLCISIKQCN